MIRFLCVLMALWASAASAQLASGLETTPKSLFFAGRCLAPVMLREEVSTKDLRELPSQFAVPHLFGEDGTVWQGSEDNLLLVKLDAGAACGVNVFDETLAEVESFMDYWLIREDSPLTLTERKETDDSVTLIYDGFCEDCGFNVHARALWLKDAKFSVYRVFATTPPQEDS